LSSIDRVTTLALLLAINTSRSAAAPGLAKPGSWDGWATNAPAVYHLRLLSAEASAGPPVSFAPPPAQLPPELRLAMLTFLASANVDDPQKNLERLRPFFPGVAQ
jgi:hypothetical protein